MTPTFVWGVNDWVLNVQAEISKSEMAKDEVSVVKMSKVATSQDKCLRLIFMSMPSQEV